MLEGLKSCECKIMTLVMCVMCAKLLFSASTTSNQDLVRFLTE